MSLTYYSVIPENNKSSYTEYDTVDFIMSYENASLITGTVRLEGTVSVLENSIPLYNATNVNKDIKYDKNVGGHSFVESIQTEIQGQVIENLTEYPRMVKMKSVARDTSSDMFNSSRVCEMKAPYDEMTTVILQGEQPPVQAATQIYNNPDFSIKLDFCLNSVDSQLIPYDRTGSVRVSVNLARTYAIFYGRDVSSVTSYSLHDLRLVFKGTDAMPESNKPVVLRKVQNIKASLQTPLANIQTKVPSNNVEAMTASFQIQARENTQKYNNLDLEKIPNLDELQFLFNDSTNQAITYQLQSNSDVLYNYLRAMLFTDRNSVGTVDMNNNNGYGVGYKFDEPIDLTQQKLGIQINSAISNTKPLIMYMYFHSVMEL